MREFLRSVPSPEDQVEEVLATVQAIDLMDADQEWDDNVFTPPGSSSLNQGKPPEATSVPAEPKDHPPHLLGGVALEIPISSSD